MKLSKYLLLLVIFSPLANAGQILVAGASSLADGFTEIVSQFEAKNPDIQVHTSFAASDVVLQQIKHGAPVDVFVAADNIVMDQAEQLGLVQPASRRNFTRNQLVLVKPAHNNKAINSLADLIQLAQVQADIKFALGNPDFVPAGRYTKAVLKQQNAWQLVQNSQVTAQNVRQALSYVAQNQVDAGFVFKTDALLLPKQISIIEYLDTEPILYPMAIVQNTKNQADANLFLNYILSADAQFILAKYGFLKP